MYHGAQKVGSRFLSNISKLTSNDSNNTYADLRPNPTLATVYAEAMANMGSEVRCDLKSTGVPGSTDQGQ